MNTPTEKEPARPCSFSLPDKQVEFIRREANKLHMSGSAYVRMLIREIMPETKKTPRK